MPVHELRERLGPSGQNLADELGIVGSGVVGVWWVHTR
jgi:hypothetical protein